MDQAMQQDVAAMDAALQDRLRQLEHASTNHTTAIDDMTRQVFELFQLAVIFMQRREWETAAQELMHKQAALEAAQTTKVDKVRIGTRPRIAHIFKWWCPIDRNRATSVGIRWYVEFSG